MSVWKGLLIHDASTLTPWTISRYGLLVTTQWFFVVYLLVMFVFYYHLLKYDILGWAQNSEGASIYLQTQSALTSKYTNLVRTVCILVSGYIISLKSLIKSHWNDLHPNLRRKSVISWQRAHILHFVAKEIVPFCGGGPVCVLLQIILLGRQRDITASDTSKALWEKPLLRTIKAIASNMRNTGWNRRANQIDASNLGTRRGRIFLWYFKIHVAVQMTTTDWLWVWESIPEEMLDGNKNSQIRYSCSRSLDHPKLS